MVQQRDDAILRLNQRIHELEDRLDHKAVKGYLPSKGMESIDLLKEKLDRALQQNAELKKDLVGSQRIQIEQSKALEKITNEGEFPTRMKGLMDELRVEKEKNSKMRE